MNSRGRRALWVIVVAAAGLAAIVYAFLPRPVEVDVAFADRGAMRVTVNQDGKTRVKQRYVISAPLAGFVRRITLDEGDPVVAGETILAVIDPTPPALLDVRQREEADARVRAAEAALQQAEPAIARAQAELEQAKIESKRIGALAQRDAASQEEAERRQLEVTAREAALNAALAARDVARFQLEQARAALTQLQSAAATGVVTPFEILSPINGRVLRVSQESAGPVSPGATLLEIADVGQLEAVIDVLSRDAVKIEAGDEAMLERWGGGESLRGVVRLIEPSGFTKISALGVEEQRVNVIVDFDPDQLRNVPLGDGYRVDARIVVWEEPDVLKVPTGALFRDGEHWAVFALDGRRARLRRIQVGRMNEQEAEILEGLRDAERIVIHPSDKIRDGVAVKAR